MRSGLLVDGVARLPTALLYFGIVEEDPVTARIEPSGELASAFGIEIDEPDEDESAEIE